MTHDTPRFIRRLAASVTPVRPLPDPWIRAATWCAGSLPVVGLIVLALSRSTGFMWPHIDRRLVLEQLAALATGVTAGAAAFATTVPGYRRLIALLPLVPLTVWLGDLGQSCVQDGFVSGSSQWSFLAHWGCLPVTMLVGAFPAAMMVLMLRRGAPLTPRLTTVLGAVSAAGLANFGVRFVHAADASIVVLAWHFSAIFVLCVLSAVAGRSLFSWRQLMNRSRVVA
jgi:hypothetical protein